MNTAHPLDVFADGLLAILQDPIRLDALLNNKVYGNQLQDNQDRTNSSTTAILSKNDKSTSKAVKTRGINQTNRRVCKVHGESYTV